MLLVFCIILVTMIVLSIGLLLLSTVTIKVNTIEISNNNIDKKVKYDYQMQIQLALWKKVKWLSITINKEKIKKLQLKQKLQKIDIKQFEKKLLQKGERKQLLEKLQIQLKSFHLSAEIGTEDVILTSGIVAIISALLGIGLAKVIKKYEKDNYGYIIQPVYQNRNIINLKLNCIIQVKMVHIINCIIYVLLRKRRVEKYERASHRRPYDYGYE